MHDTLTIPEMLAALVKNQDRPSVKLTLDSKGQIKPEVHAYGQTVGEAGREAQAEFDRLRAAYGVRTLRAEPEAV